jgi:hypothetical protein
MNWSASPEGQSAGILDKMFVKLPEIRQNGKLFKQAEWPFRRKYGYEQ